MTKIDSVAQLLLALGVSYLVAEIVVYLPTIL